MVTYGDYVDYHEGQEEEAKECMKKTLHNLIDRLCESDDFWIKTKRDKRSAAIHCRPENSLGWKIAVFIPTNEEEL